MIVALWRIIIKIGEVDYCGWLTNLNYLKLFEALSTLIYYAFMIHVLTMKHTEELSLKVDEWTSKKWKREYKTNKTKHEYIEFQELTKMSKDVKQCE